MDPDVRPAIHTKNFLSSCIDSLSKESKEHTLKSGAIRKLEMLITDYLAKDLQPDEDFLLDLASKVEHLNYNEVELNSIVSKIKSATGDHFEFTAKPLENKPDPYHQELHTERKRVIIERFRELSPNMPLENLVAILDRANTDEERDLLERLFECAKDKETTIAGKCRQLSDMGFFLGAFLEKKEERQELLKPLQKAHEALSQELLQPWKSNLELIREEIRSLLSSTREIQTNLSTLDSQKTSPLTDKTFANIHAESRIKDDPELEGNSSGAVINHLLGYVETHHKEASWQPNMVNMLKGAADIQNIIDAGSSIRSESEYYREFSKLDQKFYDALEKQIDGLETGEKALLNTGWVGFPAGHSMKLTIEKQSNGDFKIMLYNLGGGIDAYHPRIQENGQSFYQPFIEIADIKKEKLLDPIFTSAFLEMQINHKHAGSGQDTEYGPHDIYGLFLKGLQGTLLPPSTDRNQYMLPQNAGTCTWASFDAFFHTELSSKDYHQFKTGLNSHDVSSFYQNTKDLESNPTKRLLLQTAVTGYSIGVSEAFDAEALTPKELQIHYDTIKEATDRLENIEKNSNFLKLEEEVVPEINQTEKNKILPIKHSHLTEAKSTSTSLSNFVPSISEAENIDFDFKWLEGPDTIAEGLESLLLTSKQYPKVLEDFFTVLARNHSTKIWEAIPQNQIERVMVSLGTISERLMQPPQKNGRVYGVYALTINALQITLALKIPELQSLKFGSDSDQYLIPNFFGGGALDAEKNIFSSDVRQLRDHIFEVLKNHPKEPGRFVNYFEGDEKREGPIISDYYTLKYSTDAKFIDELLNKDNVLLERLKKAYPHFEKDLSNRFFQIALALCDLEGKDLPKEFGALIKSRAVAEFLLQNPHYDFKQRFAFQLEPKQDGKNQFLLLNQAGKIKKNDAPKSSGKIQEAFDIREKRDKRVAPRIKEFQYISEADIQARGLPASKKALELLITTDNINEDKNYWSSQVFKTISHYTENLELLQNKEERNLLSHLLFESNFIEEILSKNPEAASLFSQFVEKGYQTFIERGEVETALFFVEIGRCLDPIIALKTEKHHLRDFRQELTQLLSTKPFNHQEKALIYTQIAASYATHPPQKLTALDASLLIKANIYMRVSPASIENASMQVKDELQAADNYLRDPLRELVINNEGSTICQNVILEFVPDAKNKEWFCGFPKAQTSDGEYAFNFETCSLRINGKYITGLPDSILSDRHFRDLFSKKEYTTTHIQNGYQFTDERGLLTQVEQRKDGIVIRQQIDGNWFQLSTLSDFSDTFNLPKSFRDASYDLRMWTLLGNDLFVIEMRDKDYQLTHKIHVKDGNIASIDKVVDGEETDRLAVLSTATQHPLAKVCKGAMFWEDRDTGKLKSIEIPSLNMSFSVKESIAYSDQFPGYFLALNQRYRGLAPVDGSLVLENEAGERKLVVPYGEISNRKKGSLNPVCRVDDYGLGMIDFNLDQDRKPIAKTSEEGLYLGSLLFAGKKYKEAQNLIRASHSKVTKYSSKSLDLLRNVPSINQNDHSPFAAAVVLAALSQSSVEDLKVPDNTDQRSADLDLFLEIAKSYFSYKQQTSVIPDLLLTKEEELKAIRYLVEALQILDKNELPGTTAICSSLLRKAHELENETTLPSSIYIPERVSIKKTRAPLNFANLCSESQEPKKYSPSFGKCFMYTRPGPLFMENFLKFYEYALDPRKHSDLNLILASAEEDRDVPLELVTLLRETMRSSGPSLKSVQEMLLNKEENKFLELIASAQASEKDLALQPKKEIPLQNLEQKDILKRVVSPFDLKQLPKVPLLKQIKYDEVQNEGVSLNKNELKELQKAVNGDHPSLESEKLSGHIQTYWSQSTENWHRLKNPEEIMFNVQLSLAELGKRTLVLEEELLEFANQHPEDVHQALQKELGILGGTRQKITLKDLIVFTARSRHFSIAHKILNWQAKNKNFSICAWYTWILKPSFSKQAARS